MGKGSVFMKKNFLIMVIVLALVMCFAVAVSAQTYYEPYTLSYNSNHKDTGWYRGGPHAGWVLDNRGGTPLSVNSIEYNTFQDTSTEHASSFYKNLNKVDEGVVTLETSFKIANGRDGFKIRFIDENGKTVYSLETIGGNFKTLQPDASYRLLRAMPSTIRSINVRITVKLDFENKVAHTYINDSYYNTDPLLSDNIMRFAYMSDEKSTITVNLTNTTKITANYYIHDDFLYHTSTNKILPYGWTSTDLTNAHIKSTEGFVSNNATLTRAIDSAVSGKVAFEGIFYASTGAKGSLKLVGSDVDVADITFDGKNITSSGVVAYKDYLENFWNKFRIEADLVNHTADIKINGRKVKTVDLPEISYVNGIKITSDNTAEIKFDDIKLFSLVEHDDYVPEPVLPAKDKYSVGINVCPLWSYESTHTWVNIATFEEFRPVLGYYDEGNPEVADWEIKMLAEHGVDFQAFCWYADKGNGPLKHQRHSMALHDGYMNAKYSDMMKYAIIWEARSGSAPTSMQAVYDYFVPYWIENYFKDDRYMTVDGNLIMFVYDYGTYIHHGICGSNFSNTKTLFATIKGMVEEATGMPLVILSVMPESAGSSYLRSAGLDGVSAYHWNKGGSSWDYTREGIINAANAAKNNLTWSVPTISTGFNTLPWVDGSRYPSISVEDFKTGLSWIKNTFLKTYSNYTRADWQKNLVMLSNWNQYGEGTYIMPSGLNGFGYLEAVREVFTDGSNADTHTDYIPTEAQLARLGKNYPQYFKPIRRTFDEKEIAKNKANGVDGKLYVNGTPIQSPETSTDSSGTVKTLSEPILPEKTASGAIYYPFDAYWINGAASSTSIAHFLNLHYEWEWDWENGKLTLYGYKDTYAEFTVGSNIVKYHGGTITLPDPIYVRDGYPMLHMDTLCEVFSLAYHYSGNSIYVTTNSTLKKIGTTLNITAPVAGAVPQTTISGTGFTANIKWSFDATSVFDPNTSYTATVTIDPAVGYTTSGLCASDYVVNGATSVTCDDSSVTLKVKFPRTAGNVSTKTTVSTVNGQKVYDVALTGTVPGNVIVIAGYNQNRYVCGEIRTVTNLTTERFVLQQEADLVKVFIFSSDSALWFRPLSEAETVA